MTPQQRGDRPRIVPPPRADGKRILPPPRRKAAVGEVPPAVEGARVVAQAVAIPTAHVIVAQPPAPERPSARIPPPVSFGALFGAKIQVGAVDTRIAHIRPDQVYVDGRMHNGTVRSVEAIRIKGEPTERSAFTLEEYNAPFPVFSYPEGGRYGDEAYMLLREGSQASVVGHDGKACPILEEGMFVQVVRKPGVGCVFHPCLSDQTILDEIALVRDSSGAFDEYRESPPGDPVWVIGGKRLHALPDGWDDSLICLEFEGGPNRAVIIRQSETGLEAAILEN